MANRTPTEEEVAYHEAGHAVACFILRRRMKVASIVPNTKDNALGYVETASLPGLRTCMKTLRHADKT